MLKRKTTQEPIPSKRNHVLLMSCIMVVSLLMVAGLAYMILNPDKRESDFRNSQRVSDISHISTIVANYVKNVGDLPSNIPLNRTCASQGNEICRIGAENCENYVDLSAVVSSVGLSTLPVDPILTSDGNGTGYYISKDGNGDILVCAPHSERNVSISIKRFVY